MQINFYPEYDKPDLLAASDEYTTIWKEDGARIIKVLQGISGLKFVENEINALVFEGISYSHPLQLRASNEISQKRWTLVHELSHRLCFGNKLGFIDKNEDKKLAAHKVIFLILYDALAELYGQDAADKNVNQEQSYGEVYQKAWDYALSMSKHERSEIFSSLVNR